MIRSSFPDATIDDRSITGLAAALWVTKAKDLDLSKYSSALDDLSKKLGLQLVDSALHCAPGKDRPNVRYYEAKAEHARKSPANMDAFVGKLAMARVTLPESSPEVIETKLGAVEPPDHLIATVAEAQNEYGNEVAKPIRRVDLISPARLGGVRFGAIGVYLIYQDPSALPTHYILEAGTATGDSKVLYFNEVGDTLINSYTGYRPTPFSNPAHQYVGKLTLAGDSPERLQVTVRRDPAGDPYIRLDVHFTETTTPEVVWPAFHILRALGIVVSRLPHVPMG